MGGSFTREEHDDQSPPSRFYRAFPVWLDNVTNVNNPQKPCQGERWILFHSFVMHCIFTLYFSAPLFSAIIHCQNISSYILCLMDFTSTLYALYSSLLPFFSITCSSTFIFHFLSDFNFTSTPTYQEGTQIVCCRRHKWRRGYACGM